MIRIVRGLDRYEPAVVTLGAVDVNVAHEVQAVKAKQAEVAKIGEFIVSDPEVRAGEPVVRGTRIPVYTLAELVRQGAPHEELLEDYPSLTRVSLDAALAYARMYPRRSRPRRAPWTDGVVVRQGRA